MKNIIDIIRQIIQTRSGGAVERSHVIRHHGSYSNAAHSWGVAMLLWYLFPKDFKRLVLACLTHDVPESWGGDIPSTVLRYMDGMAEKMSTLEANINKSLGLPAENELGADDYTILKACDRLEFYLWCREQREFGNHFADEALREVEKYLDSSKLPGAAAEFWTEIKSLSVLPIQAGVMERASRGEF